MWRRDRFSPSTSVSPAKTVLSTNFFILTITRGRYNRPEVAAVPSGSTMGSTPKYSNKKKGKEEMKSRESREDEHEDADINIKKKIM
jgi:hypothetical protein